MCVPWLIFNSHHFKLQGILVVSFFSNHFNVLKIYKSRVRHQFYAVEEKSENHNLFGLLDATIYQLVLEHDNLLMWYNLSYCCTFCRLLQSILEIFIPN